MNLALGMGLNKMRHGALLNQNEDLSDWLYKSTFNIDTNAISAEVENVAVRVFLSESTYDFAKFKAGGADVRFADKYDNVLKHEIEYWIDTPGSEEAVCWVLLPSISASNNYFVMYYGNLSAVDKQQVTDLWQAAGAVAVWHFAEGSGTLVKDSCSTPANGTDNKPTPTWHRSNGISALFLS